MLAVISGALAQHVAEGDSATAVTGISLLDSEPLAYLIRNDGSENEYYIVENRRKQGWDDAPMYDLQGRRLSVPVKGIYI